MPDLASAQHDVTALPRLAAALLAVDPAGLGGALVRAGAGAARDAWLRELAAMLPEHTPARRVPPGVSEDRLVGGLDLAATLAAGRPIAERGILASADGGLVVLPSAERVESSIAGQLIAALDTGEVAVERDGLSLRAPARVAVVALDESEPGEPGPPAALLDRLALHLTLPIALRPTQRRASGDADHSSDDADLPTQDEIAAARDRLPSVRCSEDAVRAACAAAAALGVDSLRAPLFAVRAARAVAALEGAWEIEPAHVAAAAQLVLAPRATVLPSADDDPPEEEDQQPRSESESKKDGDDDDANRSSEREFDDVVIQAAKAAIPPDVLARLAAGRAKTGGRAGERTKSPTHGRRIGTRPGDARRRRMDVLATVRAAAPWQRLRGRDAADDALRVRPADFRVRVLERKAGTTAIFVVDASGSSAAHRLAEAKGAVELLLAESYARRDRVALIAFRRTSAELVLPPTRSLARARRLLAGLAGGGGTPLAAGADAALALADVVRRAGDAPVLVFFTDGRPNVSRTGEGGREQAEADALAAARAVRIAGIAAVVIDTAPRPSPFAARFAAEAGARCIPLPDAGAREVGAAVRRAASSTANPASA